MVNIFVILLIVTVALFLFIVGISYYKNVADKSDEIDLGSDALALPDFDLTAPEILVKYLGTTVANFVVWTMFVLAASYVIRVIYRLIRGRKEPFEAGLSGGLIIFIIITTLILIIVKALFGGGTDYAPGKVSFYYPGEEKTIVITPSEVIRTHIRFTAPPNTGLTTIICGEIAGPEGVLSLNGLPNQHIEHVNTEGSSYHSNLRLTEEVRVFLAKMGTGDKLKVKLVTKNAHVSQITPSGTICPKSTY